MKKIITLILLSLVLPSCVSTSAYWKNRTFKPNKQGIVYYDSEPSLFDSEALEKRKQDAHTKMNNFCTPKKPQIVKETNEEEVTGHHTTYSSSHSDISYPYKRKSGKKGSSVISHIFLPSMSHTSGVSTNMTRHRIYIHFECK